MTTLDPATVRPRTDLPWLRRRTVRRVPPAQQSSRPATPAPVLSPPEPARPAPPATVTPAARPAAGPAAASTSTSLDLSTPTVAPAAPARPARPRRSAENGDLVLGYVPDRVTADRAAVLTSTRPTLALTRVQSGVGALVVHAAVPASAADMRLAYAYRLRTGETSVLDASAGRTVAPVGSRRPVAVATSDSKQTLRVDLRQVRELDRLVVLAYSAASGRLTWAGALRVTTTGGARVDVPLQRADGAGVLVALSVLNVDGQLVLRAENALVPGALQDACTTYGFTDIPWVDAHTPLT